MKSQRTPNGFSLIELMIVVAIVAILAAVAVPAYFNHILRSRQADAYHNLLDIKAAQEMFLSMENSYAGPYSTLPAAGDTFTRLLSFSYADSQYYAYRIPTASGTAFTAEAIGKFKKLSGNILRIKNDTDPCVVPNSGSLEMTLNLEDCPP
jgi:type IV pilus assembly protein PilE